jgi:hypothetical protein
MGSMPALQVVRVPSFLNVIVYFNTLHPETTKPDVRRALCMAVDRDALLKTIMLGYAAPQELWCTSAQPACSLEGLKPYKYDPQQARDLLRQGELRLRQAVALRRTGAGTSGREQGNVRGDHRILEAHRRAGQSRDPGIRRRGTRSSRRRRRIRRWR